MQHSLSFLSSFTHLLIMIITQPLNPLNPANLYFDLGELSLRTRTQQVCFGDFLLRMCICAKIDLVLCQLWLKALTYHDHACLLMETIRMETIPGLLIESCQNLSRTPQILHMDSSNHPCYGYSIYDPHITYPFHYYKNL